MPKNPYLAAILNFVLYGLGYVYIGKKIPFGILLIIVDLVFVYSVSVHNVVFSIPFNLAWVLLGISFAYDGYKDAKQIK